MTDSITKAADIPIDSGFLGDIPQSFKDFYEKSRAVEKEKVMSKEEWEALETLRIKNDELNNYIEELEEAEKKWQQSQEESKKQLKS